VENDVETQAMNQVNSKRYRRETLWKKKKTKCKKDLGGKDMVKGMGLGHGPLGPRKKRES